MHMKTSATASHAAEEGLSSAKNRRVSSIAFIVVAGTWLATVFHYVLGIYKSKPYPLNTYLFRANDNFMDFYNNLNYASHFMSGKKDVIAYSPFAQTVMGALSAFPVRLALVLAMTAFMVTVGMLVWRFLVDDLRQSLALRLAVAFILTAMTYPVLFTLDRGNEEAFVFIALAWFAYLYFVEHSRWAGVLLGMAIAYKMYPGVLVVLFVADRRWKDLLITGVTTLGLTAAGTFLLGALSGYGPVLVLRYWFNTLFVGHVGYSGTLEAAQHGHSIWGAVVTLMGRLQGGEPVGLSTRAYVIVALLSFVALSAYVVFAERSDWKRVTLLVIAMLILPLESHDYTLIHLLIPIALFVNSVRGRLDMVYAVLFGLLLIPLDYYIVINEVSSAAFIYPAALLAIVAMIVGQRFMGAGARGSRGKDGVTT